MSARFSFHLASIAVEVTERDIEHGNSRDCAGCAIALAINRILPRLGFGDHYARISPYGAWTEPRGLEIFVEHSLGRPILKMPVSDFPSGVIEWAMDFDDWAEFRDDHWSDLRRWRESYGKDADEPFPPSPTIFNFNFGKLASQ